MVGYGGGKVERLGATLKVSVGIPEMGNALNGLEVSQQVSIQDIIGPLDLVGV